MRLIYYQFYVKLYFYTRYIYSMKHSGANITKNKNAILKTNFKT